MENTNFEEMEPRIIKTYDENGEIHDFELIDIIEIDGQEYGLLVHLGDESDDEEHEEEVVVMKLSKEDDAYTFEMIEDDDEFNKVIEYLEVESDLEEDEE